MMETTELQKTPMGRIRITHELLSRLLKLPEGTRILRMREHPQIVNGTSDLEIVVTGPQLPLCRENEVVPEVQAYYRTEFPSSEVFFVRYDWFGKEIPCPPHHEH